MEQKSTPDTHAAYMCGVKDTQKEFTVWAFAGFMVGLLSGMLLGIIVFAIINAGKLH